MDRSDRLDPAPAPEPRHPRPVIVFHWAVAASIAILAASGWTMTRLPAGSEVQFAFYQVHKAAGLAVLLLSLARLVSRQFATPLRPLDAADRMRRLAWLVHAGLLVLTLAVPVAGWALVSASRLDIPVEILPGLVWPRIPFLMDLAPATKAAWEPVLARIHGTLAAALVILAALHAAAALHRHVIRGDATLRRMLPLVLVTGAVFASTVASSHDWRVERDRSTLQFVGLETGMPFQGRFTRWSARIVFDPGRLEEARIDVEVDIASATTGDGRRDAAMLSEEWLDATVFPRATFSAVGFRGVDENTYEATGVLSLRGNRRPVTLRFMLRETPDGTRARGGTSLIRTAFGIGRGRWSGLQIVAAEVEVTFDLLARPAP
jgi:cytochrome b561